MNSAIIAAIRRFDRSQVLDKKKKKTKKPYPQHPTPIEVMMSDLYKEWKARREKLIQEKELLTQEADHVHEELMSRWKVGDPASELNNYNVDLLFKIKEINKALEINLRAEPKGVT